MVILEIIDEVRNTLKNLGISDTKFEEIKHKIELAKADFLSSDAIVYCQTCSIIFYVGMAIGIMKKDEVIWDFRYLAFRHAWDNPTHRVMVSSTFLEKRANKYGSLRLWDDLRDYSIIVDKLRQRLRNKGNPQAWRLSDENWNRKIDRVKCSICKTVYDNIEDACNCCREQKPFLPFGELSK